MAKLTLEDIARLADMAKIEISQNEKESYLQDINNILGNLSLIQEAISAETTPKFNFSNVARADLVVVENFDREVLLQNIPDKTHSNFVKVSKVLNK